MVIYLPLGKYKLLLFPHPCKSVKTGFIHASLGKIQGLFKDFSKTSKDFPSVFKD